MLCLHCPLSASTISVVLAPLIGRVNGSNMARSFGQTKKKTSTGVSSRDNLPLLCYEVMESVKINVLVRSNKFRMYCVAFAFSRVM